MVKSPEPAAAMDLENLSVYAEEVCAGLAAFAGSPQPNVYTVEDVAPFAECAAYLVRTMHDKIGGVARAVFALTGAVEALTPSEAVSPRVAAAVAAANALRDAWDGQQGCNRDDKRGVSGAVRCDS